MTQSSSIWMGGLTSEMDSPFIIGAFANMGYTALSVKEIHNASGERSNYCFVDFGDVTVAREVVIKINNQPIPGLPGNKRFRLNRSEYGRSAVGETEYSLFVGDLSPEVSDDMLLDFFRKRYKSVRVAKVVCDENGYAKGYGFVRFYNEQEYNSAVSEMNGASGLGARNIRVNRATKSRSGNSSNSGGGDVKPAKPPDFMDPAMIPGFMQLQMQYMQQMQEYMAQCHQYAQQAAACAGWTQPDQQPTGPPSIMGSIPPPTPQTPATPMASGGPSSTVPTSAAAKSEVSGEGNVLSYIQQQHEQLIAEAASLPEDEELVDPDPPIDVAALNQKIIDLDDRLFFQLEESRWCPELAVFGLKEQRPQKLPKSVIVID